MPLQAKNRDAEKRRAARASLHPVRILLAEANQAGNHQPPDRADGENHRNNTGKSHEIGMRSDCFSSLRL